MSTLLLSLIVFMIMGMAGLGGSGKFLDQYMSSIPGNNNSATATPIQIPTDTPPANTTPTVPIGANCLSSPVTENFDATTLNQTLWTVAKDANNIGKVEFFSGLMKATAGNSSSMSWAGLMTQKKACGNFEARVSLPNFTAGDGSEAVARLSIEKATGDTPDFSNDAVVIEVFKKNTQYAIKTIHYLDETALDQAETDYPYNSTRLMIKRENKDISVFYNEDGIWKLLKKFTNVHNADSFLFIGVKSSINNPAVSSNFDDFQVNSSAIAVTSTPVPTGITNTPTVSIPTIQPTTQANVSPMSTPTLLSCPQNSGNSYGSIDPLQKYPAGDPPPDQHADLNIILRGYVPTIGEKNPLVLGEAGDPKAPQIWKIIDRRPTIVSLYKVFGWDWTTNKRTTPQSDNSVAQVQMIGIQTNQGENIKVPTSGYVIGGSYNAMVLYADNNNITLKYTREDNIGINNGYAIQIEGICVDANLLSLYNQLNSAGRNELPAVSGGSVIGKANNTEIRVVIRDTGDFLDPRSKLDWWQGY